MTTNRGARKAPSQRICAFCASGIAGQRPVFLVATSAGHIVGPYHAGCAETVYLDSRKHQLLRLEDVDSFGRILQRPPGGGETR